MCNKWGIRLYRAFLVLILVLAVGGGIYYVYSSLENPYTVKEDATLI